jgi:hypothetical protein
MMRLASETTIKIALQPMTSSRAVARGTAINVPTFDILVFSANTAPRFFGK